MESRARLREEEGMLDRRRIAVRLSIASALRERASDCNCAIALCCEGYREGRDILFLQRVASKRSNPSTTK